MHNKKEEKQCSLHSSFFPKNKRGQGLSTNAIILIVLGVIILAVLIIGFTFGWNSFKNIMSPTNVDSLIEECGSVCGLTQEYSFCSAERTLRVNEDDLEVKSSCAVFSTAPEFSKYKISECSQIDCDLSCSEIIVGGKAGIVQEETIGKYDVSSLANDLEEGQFCIIN